MISVRRLPGIPESWWDELACRVRSPWQCRAMALVQQHFKSEPVFLIAEEAGRVLGGVCFYISGSRRFPWLDPLFARTVLVPDEPAILERPDEVLPVLLQAVEDELAHLEVVAITWRAEMPRHLRPEDLARRGYAVEPHGVGILELPSAVDDLDSRFHRSARKQIRKAERLGVRIEIASGVEPLLPLLDRSFRRAGLPDRNHDYVRLTHEMLGGEVLVASRDGRNIAALLWAAFGETGLNIFHGRDDGTMEGASNLLHRELLARAVGRGVKVLHTGGAALAGETDPRLLGITRFKENMGFVVHPAFHARRILRPLASAIRDTSLFLWSGHWSRRDKDKPTIHDGNLLDVRHSKPFRRKDDW